MVNLLKHGGEEKGGEDRFIIFLLNISLLQKRVKIF